MDGFCPLVYGAHPTPCLAARLDDLVWTIYGRSVRMSLACLRVLSLTRCSSGFRPIFTFIISINNCFSSTAGNISKMFYRRPIMPCWTEFVCIVKPRSLQDGGGGGNVVLLFYRQMFYFQPKLRPMRGNGLLREKTWSLFPQAPPLIIFPIFSTGVNGQTCSNKTPSFIQMPPAAITSSPAARRSAAGDLSPPQIRDPFSRHKTPKSEQKWTHFFLWPSVCIAQPVRITRCLCLKLEY